MTLITYPAEVLRKPIGADAPFPDHVSEIVVPTAIELLLVNEFA